MKLQSEVPTLDISKILDKNTEKVNQVQKPIFNNDVIKEENLSKDFIYEQKFKKKMNIIKQIDTIKNPKSSNLQLNSISDGSEQRKKVISDFVT
jgi:hypothetical protein